MKLRLLVLGNGMASHRLCRRLAEGGGADRFDLTVLGEEPRPAYDRVHMTRVLEGAAPASLELAPASWYAERGLKLLLGDPAAALDREGRSLRTRSGRVLDWDLLVFATGSSAYLPPIPGISLPGVFAYRTLEDLDRLRVACAPGRRVVVLGGGLLGIEAAQALRGLGAAVSVFEVNTSVLARQLDRDSAAFLKGRLTAGGLDLRTGVQVGSIEAADDRLVLAAGDRREEADVVLAAVGIRPRDELARACGLAVGARGGILTDETLRASDPNVFAVGECAAALGQLYGFVAPAYRMADVLADRLLGGGAVFEAKPFPVRLKIAGVDVVSIGEPHTEGSAVVHAAGGGFRRLVVLDGRLMGATAVDASLDLERLERAIAEGERVGWRALRRFRATGRLWPEAPGEEDVACWPATATVCACAGVTRGALSTALAGGACTPEALAAATGASTVCGGCKPLLRRLLGEAPPAAPRRVRKGLLIASLASAAGAALWLAGAPGLPARSAADGWRTMLEGGAARQATGFAAAGLAALGLLLSLRKRWNRVNAGSLGAWRFVHAVLGLLALAAVAAHTGFRPGSRLNFLLLLSFLAMASLGAAAGGAVAWEERLPAATALRWRQATLAAHLSAFWAWPVLLFFHVFSVYYF